MSDSILPVWSAYYVELNNLLLLSPSEVRIDFGGITPFLRFRYFSFCLLATGIRIVVIYVLRTEYEVLVYRSCSC